MVGAGGPDGGGFFLILTFFYWVCKNMVPPVTDRGAFTVSSYLIRSIFLYALFQLRVSEFHEGGLRGGGSLDLRAGLHEGFSWCPLHRENKRSLGKTPRRRPANERAR